MTPKQIKLARHALGLPNKSNQSYRNYFTAGKGHADYATWNAMVANGLAKVIRDFDIYGGDDVFRLTTKGARAALENGEKLCPKDFPQAVEK